MMYRDRFCRLWQRNLEQGSAEDADQVFELLATSYADPRRYYHDEQHIAYCLHCLDRYRQQVEDPDALELAIWFHDACYCPDPVGHEQRAAELFRQRVAGRINQQRLEKIIQMILLTDHQQATDDPELALLLDIDLASFARPWHEYLKDTALCRAEMKLLSETDYCVCQTRFLNQLQSRDQLYYHPQFRADNEQAARDNIARLLTLLERRSQRHSTGL